MKCAHDAASPDAYDAALGDRLAGNGGRRRAGRDGKDCPQMARALRRQKQRHIAVLPAAGRVRHRGRKAVNRGYLINLLEFDGLATAL